MKFRFLLAGAAAAFIALAVACGGNPTGPQNGNFTMMLKDTPFGDAKAVLITFSEVSVHASGGSWQTLTFANGATSRTCDLKQLQGAQDVLGTAALPAGHYTGIRLTITSAALYFDNTAPAPACAPSMTVGGRSSNLQIPPGQIFLNREFDIAASGAVTMVLDFNGNQSINQTGNGTYTMSPVVGIVSVSGQ